MAVVATCGAATCGEGAGKVEDAFPVNETCNVKDAFAGSSFAQATSTTSIALKVRRNGCVCESWLLAEDMALRRRSQTAQALVGGSRLRWTWLVGGVGVKWPGSRKPL